jgi:hypothetical protein
VWTPKETNEHHHDFFGGYTVIILLQNLQHNDLDKFIGLVHLKYKTLDHALFNVSVVSTSDVRAGASFLYPTRDGKNFQTALASKVC